MSGKSTYIENVEKHAKEIFSQSTLAKDRFYDTSLDEQGGMLRPIHGPLHASSVALYAIIFINLYKKFATKEDDPNRQFFLPDNPNYITEDDLKLLQIVALLHDSKRPEDTGSNLEWDIISAKCCEEYLINIGVGKEKAMQFANIISNKEPPFDKSTEKYNFLAKILHDADALDIIRVYSNNFDMRHLKFFQDYCQPLTTDLRDPKDDTLKVKTNKPLKALGNIVMSVRHFIARSGNFLYQYNWPQKLSFERVPNSYDLVKEELCKDSIFKVFFNSGLILTDEQASSISTRIKTTEIEQLLSNIDNIPETDPKLIRLLPELMKMGRVFMRSVTAIDKHGKMTIEENIEEELKQIANSPQGNIARSTSLIGYGSKPFKAGSGLLVLNTKFNRIRAISAQNLLSGHGDKSTWAKQNPLLSEKTAKEKSKRLRGQTIAGQFTQTHNEVPIDITKEDKIFIILSSYEPNEILKVLIMKQKYPEILKRKPVILGYSQNSNELSVLNPETLLIQFITYKLQCIYLQLNQTMFDCDNEDIKRNFLNEEISKFLEYLECLELIPPKSQQNESFFNSFANGIKSKEELVNYFMEKTKTSSVEILDVLINTIKDRNFLMARNLLKSEEIKKNLLSIENKVKTLEIITLLNQLISQKILGEGNYDLIVNLLLLLITTNENEDLDKNLIDQIKNLFINLIKDINLNFNKLTDLFTNDSVMLSFFIKNLSKEPDLKKKLLYMAIANDNITLFNILIENGIDNINTTYQDANRSTPYPPLLEFAIRQSKYDIVIALLKYQNLNLTSKQCARYIRLITSTQKLNEDLDQDLDPDSIKKTKYLDIIKLLEEYQAKQIKPGTP